MRTVQMAVSRLGSVPDDLLPQLVATLKMYALLGLASATEVGDEPEAYEVAAG
jgi:hypothetical protein